MQLFVRGLQSATVVLEAGVDSSVFNVKNLIEQRTGVPAGLQGLVFAGRQLDNSRSLVSYGVVQGSTFHLVLALRGGKGGFGALLRGQGRDGKITTNFDACRDLSGRRIRHVNAEKKLADHMAQAKERELEKVAVQHIKEVAKQAKKDVEQKVNVDQVKEEQRHTLAKVQDAVQTALASAPAQVGKKRCIQGEIQVPKRACMLNMLVSNGSDSDSSGSDDD